MPVSIGAIIGGIVDAVATTAEAVGGALVGGAEAAGIGAADVGAAAAGAEAAGATAAIPTAAEAAATAGEIAAAGGGVALPTIEEVGTLGGIVGGAGTEAALGGGAAALGGATEAALAGGGLAGGEALAAGGGLAGGVLGGAELASLLGGGTTAGLTGGALPGATPVPTTGVSNVAETFGTPAPVTATQPTTGGVALGSPTAGGVPADVLQGTTGPLSALQPQNAPFETLWQPGQALSLAEPGPVNPLATLPDTGAFAGAPAAVPGQTTESVANALNIGVGAQAPPATSFADLLESPTGAQELTAGTGIATPEPLGTPAATPAAAAPTSLATAPAATADVAASQAVGSTAAPGSLTTGGGGVSGALGNLFSGSTLRTAGMLAPLGALGLTLARGQPSLPPAEQAAVANVGPGSPIANVAGSQLTEGATGQLTPGQTAQVNQYVSDAKNQLFQLYARMGRDPTNDTDYIQGLATIDRNAQVMTQQFITAAIQNGIQAQGVIDQTLQAAATLQAQQDEAFQASIASATQAFGLTAALSAATARA